jgi:hypothetical protein
LSLRRAAARPDVEEGFASPFALSRVLYRHLPHDHALEEPIFVTFRLYGSLPGGKTLGSGHAAAPRGPRRDKVICCCCERASRSGRMRALRSPRPQCRRFHRIENYIVPNPVRAGLARPAEEYPCWIFSSPRGAAGGGAGCVGARPETSSTARMGGTGAAVARGIRFPCSTSIKPRRGGELRWAALADGACRRRTGARYRSMPSSSATRTSVPMRRSTCDSVCAAVTEMRSRFCAAAGRSTGLM